MGISAALKTCIYQGTWAQKFSLFLPLSRTVEAMGFAPFLHCVFYERPSEEAISKWSWQRKGLLWSVKRLHLDPASVPETACCAKQKSLCANSPITHFLSPLNSAWLGNCQLSNSIEESLFWGKEQDLWLQPILVLELEINQKYWQVFPVFSLRRKNYICRILLLTGMGSELHFQTFLNRENPLSNHYSN